MAACSAAVSPLRVWVCNEAPGREQAGALRALSEWIARSSRKSFTLPRAAAKLCTASRESVAVQKMEPYCASPGRCHTALRTHAPYTRPRTAAAIGRPRLPPAATDTTTPDPPQQQYPGLCDRGRRAGAGRRLCLSYLPRYEQEVARGGGPSRQRRDSSGATTSRIQRVAAELSHP